MFSLRQRGKFYALLRELVAQILIIFMLVCALKEVLNDLVKLKLTLSFSSLLQKATLKITRSRIFTNASLCYSFSYCTL